MSLDLDTLQKYSDFSRHPNVLKGKSSEGELMKEFKVKVKVFLEFQNKRTLDLLDLQRFFEFYLGNQVKDEYFWFIIQKVFNIREVDFEKIVSTSLGPSDSEAPLSNNFIILIYIYIISIKLFQIF